MYIKMPPATSLKAEVKINLILHVPCHVEPIKFIELSQCVTRPVV